MEREDIMQKTVLLPYDRYQRLLAKAKSNTPHDHANNGVAEHEREQSLLDAHAAEKEEEEQEGGGELSKTLRHNANALTKTKRAGGVRATSSDREDFDAEGLTHDNATLDPTSATLTEKQRESGGNIPPPPGISIFAKRKSTNARAPTKKVKWLKL
jgi:hypothetical protein